mmetsp:Transcript_19544/g.38689  ORF Transcript_19544/g.38689 Transcript_19544/m.38689 type:complete len:341 (-) Transcript_19544:217-1239(-)|eukprot:CAMPEP_0175137716 /NCGR_PEP_ID=MMETSP0087-20121206/9960_1 /TAXON_ID=136419 /ORGANISM="Unknown Unknown, Strain D1" /LENGTH=340 /DNA_ID=CAMNT_0016420563 /DNA_START=32 /DNA_END=1054 /DNA_ORIENTATION=+
MNRAGKYVKTDDPNASREERMTRLKFELREHIRFLTDFEILSVDWLKMAESLHQIANVAFMETHLPPSDSNPLLMQGKKTTGTLWDQERDELAVRILLEEGKLNLILRILHKYKQMTRSDQFDALVQATVQKFNSDVGTVMERCRVFEQSLGVLLKFTLSHVESLQIMDVPELIEHVGEMLREAEESEKKELAPDAHKMQCTLVIHYISSLCASMEDMDEDRIMDLIEENKIIPSFVHLLLKHYTWYRVDTLVAAALFFHNCMASEAYCTEPERFVDDSLKKHFVELKGFFISGLVTEFDLKKNQIDKLWTQLEKWEKVVGPAKIQNLKNVIATEEKKEK